MSYGFLLEHLFRIALTDGTQVTLWVSPQFYDQCPNLLSGNSAIILLRLNDLRPWLANEIHNDGFRRVHVPVQ